MVYNRDVVVNSLTRYYDLLVRMAYIPPDRIQNPPPEGWSDEKLFIERLQAHGFTEPVIDLLRHLPYFKRGHNIENTEVWLYTEPISYLRDGNVFNGLDWESCRGRLEDTCLLNPFHDAVLPRSFIPLTFGRESTWWIIDTDEGIVFPAGSLIVDLEAPDHQPWAACGKPRDIKEYFDEIYSQVETLQMVPVPKGDARWDNDIIPVQWPPGAFAARCLKEHGWPEDLDEDEYLKAVRKKVPDDQSLDK